MGIILKPIGMLLSLLYSIFGNYGLALFLFTLIVNLIMLPLSIKGQKSSANQARLRPHLEEIKKRVGDDKMKYNTEMQELYKREGVSMTGGCLPQLIRMVFVLLIYQVVNKPLTYILNIHADVISSATKVLEKTIGKGKVTEQLIIANFSKVADVKGITDIPGRLDFNVFGLNLAQKPEFSWNIFQDFQMIWIIPILAFATAMISSLASMKMNKITNPDAPTQMMGMMLLMPFVSLIFAFQVPGAVGFYWACSNVVSSVIQLFVQYKYNPNRMVAKMQADNILKRRQMEKKKIELSAGAAELAE